MIYQRATIKVSFWVIGTFFLIIFPLSGQSETKVASNLRQKQPVSLLTRSLRDKPYTEVSSAYRMYHALLSEKKLAASENVLSSLEKNTNPTIRLIGFYERLIYLSKKESKRELLEFLISSVHSPEFRLLDAEIQSVVIELFTEQQDKTPLKPFFDQITKEIPAWLMNPEMVTLYLASHEMNDPQRNQVAIDHWVYADVVKFPPENPNLLTYIKENAEKYQFEIKNHFIQQYKYRNYTYIINAIPGFLPSFRSSPENLKTTRKVYFKSLIRKRHYSKLLTILESETYQDLYQIEDFERRIYFIQSHLRKGNILTARSALDETVRVYPDESFVWTYLEFANTYFNRNDYGKALPLYLKIMTYPIEDDLLEDIQWKLVQVYEKLDRDTELNDLFKWSERHEFAAPGMAAQFCYWGVKLGRTRNKNLMSCYKRYPFTYYGYRAYYQTSLENPGNKPYYPFITGSHLERLSENEIEFLQLIGLVYENDRPELGDVLVRRYMAKNDNPVFFAYLSGMLYEAGRYYMQQLMVDIYYRSKIRNRDPQANTLLTAAFPVGYYDEIAKYNDKSIVPEQLVLAVIREESNFRPDVESVAGAIGLMQLMPATAKYIGKTIRLTVSVDQLVDPELNVRLGAAYLKRLLKRYDGNMYYALAAYNGGPTNVKRWKKKISTNDMDQFVESIPFIETKNYVKRVIRSYFVYLQLYG